MDENDFDQYSKFNHQLNNVLEYFRCEIINEKKKSLTLNLRKSVSRSTFHRNRKRKTGEVFYSSKNPLILNESTVRCFYFHEMLVEPNAVLALR